jgi:sirohydrochlorin ferrochelatase
MVQRPHCFLFDNGSLRAASTLNLRAVARALAPAIEADISAVSLLHSSGVPAESLDGVAAQLLEPALLNWLGKNPQGCAVLLPFFFGPSGALTEYLAARLQTIHAKFPEAEVRMAKPLVDIQDPDTKMASALADAARRAARDHSLVRPRVLLVDHGSPQYAVTLVRNFLGDQVRALLADEAASVGVASMERRAGPEFAFTDPLLASALATPPFDAGDVIVLLQFLSPGRHAGAGGDIAEICGEAQRGNPQLRTFLTEPIGQDPRIIELLAQRYWEALR